MPTGLNESNETAIGMVSLIAAVFSERLEAVAPELLRWWIRLSIAWFGILSLCVLLASGGLLMKSEVLAHLYLWLVLEVAAALFVVPFVVVPIVVWGFLWAARIVVLCAFALHFLARPPR